MAPKEQSELGALEGFSEALRLLLKRSDLTQEEVAARTGVSRSAVNRFVNGRDRPSLDTFGRLLRYGLGVTIVDFAEALLEVQGYTSEDVLSQDDLEDLLRSLHLRLRLTERRASVDEPPVDSDKPNST